MTKTSFSGLSGAVSITLGSQAGGGHVEDVAEWGLPSPTAQGDTPALVMQQGQPATVDAAGYFFGTQMSFELAAASDALPDGVTLSSAGQISGTPLNVTPARAVIVRGTNPNGFADRAITVSVTVPVDFAVTVSPSDPFVGEVVHIDLAGTGGFDVPDPLDDIDVRWDRGFDGTYASGARNAAGVNNARVTPGREIAHVADDTTPRTLTATASVFGSAATEQVSTTITATDPDTYPWDHEYYLSYDDDFSEAPAESATVTHISSRSELMAMGSNTPGVGSSNAFYGQNVRFHYHAGEVFEWDINEYFQPGADLLYITRFGAGAKPILRSKVTGNASQILFRLGGAVTRLIVENIEIDDEYNPITGEIPGGRTNWFTRYGTAESFTSFYQCDFNIGTMLFNTADPGDHYFGLYDCSATAWKDIIALINRESKSLRMQGSKFMMNPLATRGDGKESDLYNLGDHGILRVHAPRNYGFVNNEIAQITGWSPGYGGDRAIQPAFRFNMEDDYGVTASRGSLRGNRSYGGPLFGFETTNKPSDNAGFDTVSGDHRMVIEGNYHKGVDQFVDFGTTSIGGATVQNNVVVWPNVDSGYSSDATMSLLATVKVANVSGAAASNPILIRNNTGVSKQSTDSSVSSLRDFVVTNLTSYLDGNVTEYNNPFDGTQHPNISVSVGTLSPGDQYQHLDGSVIDAEQTSGAIPAVDILGVARAFPSSYGAYQDGVASVATVTAPVNTMAPTIAAHPTLTDIYNVTDQGTWSTGFDPYQTINEWYLNGVRVSKLTRFDATGWAGTLTCNVVATNESGVRVAATSNAIMI